MNRSKSRPLQDCDSLQADGRSRNNIACNDVLAQSDGETAMAADTEE
jgi:hypothetical protein